MPLATTTVAVAVTITLAATRTEGGLLMNFDIRRSIGFTAVGTRGGISRA